MADVLMMIFLAGPASAFPWSLLFDAALLALFGAGLRLRMKEPIEPPEGAQPQRGSLRAGLLWTTLPAGFLLGLAAFIA